MLFTFPTDSITQMYLPQSKRTILSIGDSKQVQTLIYTRTPRPATITEHIMNGKKSIQQKKAVSAAGSK